MEEIKVQELENCSSAEEAILGFLAVLLRGELHKKNSIDFNRLNLIECVGRDGDMMEINTDNGSIPVNYMILVEVNCAKEDSKTRSKDNWKYHNDLHTYGVTWEDELTEISIWKYTPKDGNPESKFFKLAHVENARWFVDDGFTEEDAKDRKKLSQQRMIAINRTILASVEYLAEVIVNKIEDLGEIKFI